MGIGIEGDIPSPFYFSLKEACVMAVAPLYVGELQCGVPVAPLTVGVLHFAGCVAHMLHVGELHCVACIAPLTADELWVWPRMARVSCIEL